MTNIRIVRDYPHPPRKVWRALTDPAILARWAMRPEGLSLAVGARFRFHGKPNPAWRGFVEVEVLEAREPEVLRYRWIGNEGERPTEVAYRLAPRDGGTRLTFEHTGFVGLGGFLLAKLVMEPGHKKVFGEPLRAALAGFE